MTAEEFTTRVRALTLGTPYLVLDDEDGFTLSINLVDAQWYTVAFKRGVRSNVRYVVRLDESTQVFRITDVVTSMSWGAGVPGGPRTPVLGGSWSGFRGRIGGWRKQVSFGIDAETRRLGKVVDYSFSPAEGHGMIRSVGHELGWQEKQPGVVLGAIALGVLGLLAIPLVIVLALTGNLH